MSLSVYYDPYFKNHNSVEIALIQEKLMLGQYTPFDALVDVLTTHLLMPV